MQTILGSNGQIGTVLAKDSREQGKETAEQNKKFENIFHVCFFGEILQQR